MKTLRFLYLLLLPVVSCRSGEAGGKGGGQLLSGHYSGYLSYRGASMALSIDFRNDSGRQTALLSLPDNLQLEKPFSSLEYRHPELVLRMADGEGDLLIRASLNGDTLKGRLGGSIPAAIRLVREPGYQPSAKQYTILDTVLTNGTLRLPARLYLPDVPAPVPAAIFIAGTGNHSRDEYNGWAGLLASRGIAALTFNKRDVTSTRGLRLRYIHSDIASMDELCGDAEAAYRLLCSVPAVDSARIGVMGFSLGAVEAPVLAARNRSIAFVVAVSGNATTDRDYLIYQGLNKYRQAGYDSATLRKAAQLYAELFDFMQTGKDAIEVQQRLTQAYSEGWGRFCFPAELPNADERKYLLGWNNLLFDPAPYWKRVKVPSLLVYGGNDRYIPADESIRILLEIFAQKKQLLTIRRYPGTNHTIRTIPDSADFDFPKYPAAYPEETVGWIQAQTKPAGKR